MSYDLSEIYTAQKVKFSFKGFSGKCDRIYRKLRIWSQLLDKYLLGNFIHCAVLKKQHHSHKHFLAHVFTSTFMQVSNILYLQQLQYTMSTPNDSLYQWLVDFLNTNLYDHITN